MKSRVSEKTICIGICLLAITVQSRSSPLETCKQIRFICRSNESVIWVTHDGDVSSQVPVDCSPKLSDPQCLPGTDSSPYMLVHTSCKPPSDLVHETIFACLNHNDFPVCVFKEVWNNDTLVVSASPEFISDSLWCKFEVTLLTTNSSESYEPDYQLEPNTTTSSLDPSESQSTQSQQDTNVSLYVVLGLLGFAVKVIIWFIIYTLCRECPGCWHRCCPKIENSTCMTRINEQSSVGPEVEISSGSPSGSHPKQVRYLIYGLKIWMFVTVNSDLSG